MQHGTTTVVSTPTPLTVVELGVTPPQSGQLTWSRWLGGDEISVKGTHYKVEKVDGRYRFEAADLPEPDYEQILYESGFIPPADEEDEPLYTIWNEALAMIQDSFDKERYVWSDRWTDSVVIGGVTYSIEEMATADPHIFVPQQFENPDNARVHYEETAHELWRQMSGDVACLVAGVGSGGTLQGVGKFLKEHKPDVRIVAVEPKGVAALLGHEPGLHAIQGIGDGFIPGVLDVSLVDEVVEVSDQDAVETTRQLGRDNGLLVGISSGANVWGARRMAERIDGNVATVLPDRAERYFSTALL